MAWGCVKLLMRYKIWMRFGRWLVLGMAIALSIMVWGQGAIAQDKAETAPVVLDGHLLFDVTSFESESADSRADWINYRLSTLANSNQPVSVEVQTRNSTHSILLNDGRLLSVTQSDAANSQMAGVTPRRLARLWANEIESALEQARQERSLDYLQRSLIWAGLMIAGTSLIHWGLGRFKHRLVDESAPSQQTNFDESAPPSIVVSVFFNLILLLLRIGIWLGVAFFISNLFPFTRQWSYTLASQLINSFFSPIIPVGDNVYSVIQIVVLIGLLFVLVIGAGLVSNLLRSRILQMAGISSGAQAVIATLTRYTLIAIGMVVLLQIWGLDLSSLTLLASALGVGIGFGLQNIAKDFGSGLVLLFERPVQVGDFVEVGEFMGTVARIGARSTNIKTLSQVSVIVPNSYFLENQVINWSHDNPLSRIAIPVGVSYNSEPETVRKILLEAGQDHPDIVALPAPQVFFKGFGDSALNFELLVWLVEPNRQPIIKSDLYFSIFKLLRQHQIEIPFPQRDLHLRSGSLPVEMMHQIVPKQTPKQLSKRINGQIQDIDLPDD